MRRLVDLAGRSLWRGDILRLAENYDLGPGRGGVDLMVYDPADGAGLGLLVVSGYKAGLTLSILPIESCGEDKRSLEVDWLLANWDRWFCYIYERDEDGGLVPIPIAGTLAIGWEDREIVVKTDADSRPSRP